MVFRFLFLVSILFSCAQRGSAQHVVQKYSVITGLPSSSVSTVFKDGAGRIWIGTFSGLCRYESNGANCFSMSDGLVYNQTASMAQDSKGHMLIGSIYGLMRYDGKHFEVIQKEKIAGVVRAIYVDERGMIYVACGSRLILLSADYDFICERDYRKQIKEITKIDGHLVLGTRKGILAAGDRFKQLVNGIGKNDAASLLEMKDVILVGSDSGLFSYHKQTGIIKKEFEGNMNDLLKWNDDHVIVTTNKGTFMLKMNDAGYTVADTLLAEDIGTELCIDNDRNLWVGTTVALYKIRPTSIRTFAAAPWKFDDKNYLLNLVDTSVLISSSRNGTGVILDLDVRTGATKEVYTDKLQIPGVITGIMKDSKGDTWISTFMNGGWFQKKNSKEWKRLGAATGLVSDNIMHMMEDSRHRMWLASYYTGITILGSDTIHLTKKNGLSINFIFSMEEDQKGNMWLAGDGLLKYDGKQLYNYADSLGISHTILAGIGLRDNRLYVATVGYGLIEAVFDTYGDIVKVNRYNRNDGLLSDNVTSLCFDDKGYLWVAYNKGISRIKLHQDHISVKHLKESDGLLTNDWESAALVQAGRDICLITSEGLSFIDNRSDHFPQLSPDVYVSAVRPENTDEDITPYAKGFNADGVPEQLHLPYRLNGIAFGFSSSSVMRPEDIRYSYRLNGFENTWSKPSTDNSIKYLNLFPGNYEFEVRSFYADDPSHSAYARYAFSIEKPFWYEWWFIIPATIATVFLAGAGISYGMNRRKSRQLSKLNIKRKMAELEMKMLRAQLNPHFIFNALNSIQRLIIDSHNDLAYTYLSKFSKLLRKVLDTTSAQFITLKEEIEILRIYLEIEALRFDNSFTYDVVIDDDVDSANVHIPALLLQPYAENAIRHGLAHKATDRRLLIRIKKDPAFLLIHIEDNGIGRAHAAVLNKNRTYSHKSIGMSISRDRLKNIYGSYSDQFSYIDIVDLAGEDQEAQGTRVEIRIPLAFLNLN